MSELSREQLRSELAKRDQQIVAGRSRTTNVLQRVTQTAAMSAITGITLAVGATLFMNHETEKQQDEYFQVLDIFIGDAVLSGLVMSGTGEAFRRRSDREDAQTERNLSLQSAEETIE